MRSDESGGIVTGWLVRIVLFLFALAFVIFEGGAVVLNGILAEDAAREVARAAATAYGGTGDVDAAESAGVATARGRGVSLVEITIDGDTLGVTIRSTARTLVLHEIDALEPLTVRERAWAVQWR